ncbi:hypothetical protein bAD24_p01310 (plasmid) [Burkholderia sp. AD24]|nr:hypothetical protein bAD24_p01310 [Burkholderia sp. AD24]
MRFEYIVINLISSVGLFIVICFKMKKVLLG